MNPFLPKFEGTLDADPLPDDFAARLEDRIADGLLCRGFRSRANYRVREIDQDRVEFEAADKLTAWNVGLNDVAIWREGPNRVGYRVAYWGWTKFCVGLSLCIVAPGVLAYFLMPGYFEAEFAKYPFWMAKGLFWGMIAFWGIAWPWILTAFHKGPARKCLERILREEFARNPGAAAA